MAKRQPKSHRTGNEVVREDGRIEYEYKDAEGVLSWRFSNGQLARRHPKAPALWNSETGTQANNGRHQRVLAAREQALISAAQEVNPTVATVSDAAAIITAAQTQLATSPDMGHASTQAAKYVDKTLNLVEERAKEQGNTLTLQLTDATAARVLERLARKD